MEILLIFLGLLILCGSRLFALFLIFLMLTQVSGCVTYTHHFAPGRGSTLCSNIAACQEIP